MEIKKGDDKNHIKVKQYYSGRQTVADVTVKDEDKEATITVSIEFLVKVVAALTVCYFIFSNL